jgi:hypothetical protein
LSSRGSETHCEFDDIKSVSVATASTVIRQIIANVAEKAADVAEKAADVDFENFQYPSAGFLK